MQIHIKVPKIVGVTYSKKFLDVLAEGWFRGGKLPPGVKIFALEWSNSSGKRWTRERNPARIERARENFSRIVGLRFSA